MTITARYPGRCAKCGQPIHPGQQISWDPQTRQSTHVTCPTQSEAPQTTTQEAAPYHLSGGEGYGYTGWKRGQVVRAPQRLREQGYPEWLCVVRSSERYIRDDGMSFGVGDESGYVYSAECREATAEEAAPQIEAARKQAEIKAAKARVAEIGRQIMQTGERPEASSTNAQGERLLGEHTIYGGGNWLILAADGIWYVQGNGGDGDDWTANNLPGAIGRRIPFDAALATELRQLATILS
jgi:hypothetical protein